MTWTREQYPALRCVQRTLVDHARDYDPESWRDWPDAHREHGYWIAGVHSPRIPDEVSYGCGCAEEPACLACEADRPDWHDYDTRLPECPGCGSTARPGYRPRPADPDCRWCHGRPGDRLLGISWGLHAVVMRDAELVWDPSPRRADGVGPFRAATTWHVVDPALL